MTQLIRDQLDSSGQVGCGGVDLTVIISKQPSELGEPLSRAPGSGKLTNWPPIVLLQHPTLQGLETDADKHRDPD